MSAKLCETDIERDANGDGQFSADVCLDISHYIFSNVALGDVTVRETTPPNGWMFGTLLLTPQALQAEGSADADTNAEFDAEASTVTLDLSGDDDGDAMLHVYNFESSPATDTAPQQRSEVSLSAAPLLAVFLGTLLVGAIALRRRFA
jgi:hypothetical protein